jgi:hypothetical protein
VSPLLNLLLSPLLSLSLLQTFYLLFQGLTTLSASLPQTIPCATKEDKIYLTVLHINEGPLKVTPSKLSTDYFIQRRFSLPR